MLLAACEMKQPPAPALLSEAKVATVAAKCGVSAKTIKVEVDKVKFDPPHGMPQAKKACVLGELRARLPQVSIDYAVKIKGQTERDKP
ncbi:hypothetical protein [Novosphingobium album (ex Hu et al. 2023)]|uniref:Lipoprotein n=1 Tax=Novosphingobium album (ex Hu et al. 2023) TaxID=2930093 RepID=A0ABT0AXJ7_9SPHN|nr:hypothetical protein [Novosphingobium album (ex Hu et al. 2023)]MCJ2177547.1 hypothetical protein [Novosphingobium album (ex Hu et al. 2023)]